MEANEWGGHLAGMASEEMETFHEIPNRYPKGEYLLLFDPLDGSSNIDVNVSIGTIFSVLKSSDELGPGHRKIVPAARHFAGGGGLRGVRPEHAFGADRRHRRALLHASTAKWALGADAVEHDDPGRHQRVRHQHEQHAALGAAGQALHR